MLSVWFGLTVFNRNRSTNRPIVYSYLTVHLCFLNLRNKVQMPFNNLHIKELNLETLRQKIKYGVELQSKSEFRVINSASISLKTDYNVCFQIQDVILQHSQKLALSILCNWLSLRKSSLICVISKLILAKSIPFPICRSINWLTGV